MQSRRQYCTVTPRTARHCQIFMKCSRVERVMFRQKTSRTLISTLSASKRVFAFQCFRQALRSRRTQQSDATASTHQSLTPQFLFYAKRHQEFVSHRLTRQRTISLPRRAIGHSSRCALRQVTMASPKYCACSKARLTTSLQRPSTDSIRLPKSWLFAFGATSHFSSLSLHWTAGQTHRSWLLIIQ